MRRNPVDKDEVSYLRQSLASHIKLMERARKENNVTQLHFLESWKPYWEAQLAQALQRNPVVRAKNLDKAEEKVRKLADAARGSMASPQSKAAYRRALDELMQTRIDAGTQGTLFDIAPRQTTQRGLPGLFDNPMTADPERQYRDAARYSSPKELLTGSLDEESRLKLYASAPPEVSEKLMQVHAISKRRYQLQAEFERIRGDPRRQAAVKRDIQALNKEAKKYPRLEDLYQQWDVLTR
jgi:hypothetical protein